MPMIDRMSVTQRPYMQIIRYTFQIKLGETFQVTSGEYGAMKTLKA